VSRLIGTIIAVALCAVPATASAQAVAPGTFQISGVTGFNSNRQTIETGDVGEFQAGHVGFTSLMFAAEATYFVTRRVGVGGLASFQRLSVDVPERDAIAYVSGGYFGPFMQARLPLGDRSTFVFSASLGGIRTTLTNRNTGFGEEIDVTGYGRYWLAGSGVSISVASIASVDAGVRYQSSTFTAPGGQPGRVTSAGLLANLGFSLYFR
jgi:hypothetical protein